MGTGSDIVVWLNTLANGLGQLLAPIGWLPGWLSATLVAVVTGVGMLAVFKYTSNQRGIKRARQRIRANLLAIKLFKDNVAVGLRAQAGVLGGAARLLVLALVPMAVMLVPMTLLLGQLALWYQQRPLRVGEETVVTLTLGGAADTPFPTVVLAPTDAVEPAVGPVRVLSKREVCWSVRAARAGQHRLTFQIDGQPAEKELAVGDGFMRVSAKRPPSSEWSEALLHPREQPFATDSPVRAIEIAYPERTSWTSGTDYWVVYWFAVSLVAGFCFRRVLNVNL
jgi:uncharacterized membrane protein (DUF106 family)